MDKSLLGLDEEYIFSPHLLHMSGWILSLFFMFYTLSNIIIGDLSGINCAFPWVICADFGFLIHREILWHEEEPVQRSSGDLQDFPQQDDQTVWVSQSGRGNVRLSCRCSSSSGEETELYATERARMSVWGESRRPPLKASPCSIRIVIPFLRRNST